MLKREEEKLFRKCSRYTVHLHVDGGNLIVPEREKNNRREGLEQEKYFQIYCRKPWTDCDKKRRQPILRARGQS